MDWQQLQDGLRAWASSATGIAGPTIVWSGEAEGHRAYPHLNLALVRQDSEGMDELRYEHTEPLDPMSPMVPVMVGQRRAQLVITYKSRDARPLERAYAVLEGIRNQLELPATQEGFDALDITVRDASVTESIPGSSEQRDLSVAVLTIDLAYVETRRDDAHPTQTVKSVALDGSTDTGAETIPLAQTVTYDVQVLADDQTGQVLTSEMPDQALTYP